MKNTLKKYFLVILTILAFKSYGQTSIDNKNIDKNTFKNLDSLGKNNNPKLTIYESDYFNQIFSKKRKDFNFTNKTIAFVTGSSGKIRSSKQQYFDLDRERMVKGYSLNGGTLIIFNEIEKEQSGGYDAVILYWSKALPTKKSLYKTLKIDDKK